jgi:hypothetical protein
MSAQAMESESGTVSLGTRAPGRGAVLQPICEAIRALCRDQPHYAAACRLIADDAASVLPGGDRRRARLERALARTILDLWACGMATPEDVASAYAGLALELRALEVGR